MSSSALAYKQMMFSTSPRFSAKQEGPALASKKSMRLINQDEYCQRKDLFEELLQDEGYCSTAHAHHHHSQCKMINEDQEVKETQEQPHNQPDYQGCKCSKIDCLKLYCECFAKGRTCTSRCICVSCSNHSHNHSQIYRAKQIANYRNPDHFKGVPAYVYGKRCTCKKSSCRKNYCQCYRAGNKCTPQCQCLDCCNQKPHQDHRPYSKSYKMENQYAIELDVAA